MRKFIAFGLSAVTAGSIALTVASPAFAAETTTKTVVDDVCAAVPGVGEDLTKAITALTEALETDGTAVADTKADAQEATAAYIDAIVDHLQNAASGSPDAAISAVAVGVRSTAFVDALVKWSEALTKQFNDNGLLEYLTLQQGALEQLGTGLECVVPEV